jgi:hypothetical protein
LSAIPAANATGTLGVNTSGYAATVSGAAQGNITSVGTLTALSVTGNVTAGNVIATYYGSGAGLTSIPGANVTGTVASAATAGTSNSVAGANVTGTVASATTAATVSGAAQANITSVGTLTSLSVSGAISAAGNIAGNYILGNGALLTGVAASYGNANVAAYLPTYTGAITAATVSATGTITAANFVGNGAGLTGVVASSGSKISNGTSQANIGSTNGDIVFTVAGTGIVSVTSAGIINTQANGVGNIGNSSGYFNTIHARATSAQYADVAERFAADADYEAGTVVELGGMAEITKVGADLSDNVFGVISTNAAYLMNAGAGTDNTHPPVAMTGRVPVKVVGQVNKGDRLVSAGNGFARAAKIGEATAFNTIGRALASKLDSALGTVEAIVTIK